jgi:hypothetical protein
VVRFGARHLWTDASFECASRFSKVEITTRCCCVGEQPVQATLHPLQQHVYQPSPIRLQREVYTRGEMPKGQ